MNNRKLSRRSFLGSAGLTGLGLTLAAAGCQPKTVEVEKEVTKIVEVDKIVKETVIVEKEVTPVPTEAEPVTIRYGFHDASEGRERALEIMAEKHPHITVEYEQILDFGKKVPTMAAAGTLTDVTRMWEAMCLDMARAGQVIPLDELIASESEFDPDDWVPGLWKYPVLEGKRFAIPDAYAPQIVFYNKDLFDEAGVGYPDLKDFTWDDYLAKAVAISRPDDLIWGAQSLERGWGYACIFVWTNGGRVFSEDMTKCTLDSPEAIEAIQFWADVLLEGRGMPTSGQATGLTEDLGGGLFQVGHAGMMRNGAWNMGGLKEAEFQWSLAPMTYAAEKSTILHAGMNTISASTKHLDAAWKWMAVVTGTEATYHYAKSLTFPSGRRSANAIEPKPWVLEGVEGVDFDVIPASMDYGRVLPAPANSGEATKLFTDALDQIYLGNKSAEEALAEVAPKMTAVIAQS